MSPNTKTGILSFIGALKDFSRVILTLLDFSFRAHTELWNLMHAQGHDFTVLNTNMLKDLSQ